MDDDPNQQRQEKVSTASNILVNIKTTKLSIKMHTLVAGAQFVIYSGAKIFMYNCPQRQQRQQACSLMTTVDKIGRFFFP